MKYKKYTDQKGPLRLMIYDRTCRGKGPLPGLTHGWIAGGLVYSALGRIDAWHGAASWTEALDWLLNYAPDQQISEIQFWGHGEWGGLWIEDELIKIDALEPGHALFEQMNALRTRLIGNGNALWWFRCCDTFGTALGQDFARKWTDFFACRAAGHTYTINVLQSGLHVLENGAVPHWPESEGVVAGLSHARNSHLLAPNTITCFHGEVPES